MSEQMKTPPRIWIWPDQDAYGVQNWSKGCYRAEPRRPLDKPDGPTGAEYVPAEIMADLYAALDALRHAVCGETGFAACVRAHSGTAYPWPALDEAEAMAKAALAKARGEA